MGVSYRNGDMDRTTSSVQYIVFHEGKNRMYKEQQQRVAFWTGQTKMLAQRTLLNRSFLVVAVTWIT